MPSWLSAVRCSLYGFSQELHGLSKLGWSSPHYNDTRVESPLTNQAFNSLVFLRVLCALEVSVFRCTLFGFRHELHGLNELEWSSSCILLIYQLF